MGWGGRASALLVRNLQPTLTYWSVFFSFGLCVAFLGPTLFDLRCQTHSSLPQVTWVFFAQQFCLLLGSTLGGVFKRTLAQSLWVLFTSSLAISLVFAVIPFCFNVVVLAIVMAMAGLAMGCIDTISNMQLVKIYQKDSAIFLQVLHFFMGFGALLSPLIADPFLSESNCIQANGTANSSLPHQPRNLSHLELPSEGLVVTRLSYAFWIMALINLPVPFAVLLLLYKERLVPCCWWRSPRLLAADELALETQPTEKDSGSSLPPKAPLDQGHDDLFSCCQGKNFKGAPYSYFAIHIAGALVLFMTDGIMVGVVGTFLLLLIFSHSVIFLFVGTACLGLFLSSTFPSMLSYTEDILQYKGCATTVLVTGAGIGEMVLQLLVGSIFQVQGSYSFLVCGVIFGCLAFTFYILLLFFHRMHPRPSSVTGPDKATEMHGSDFSYQR
ncbi:major facilitator superfamily domain-containing protein 4A isoform X2 [Ornithorhynchus anatinus]|uniref:major facilitator superfamily domain-containing protein 4A isoform X2 n=1 Tax=Ornithorhynchus anatinus TaxID=9258 RepID=UPI0010A785A8|nr:major facilitator superfamily domain-containing protein 4A isoform X2 [Ornithorhynchus anatinus]